MILNFTRPAILAQQFSSRAKKHKQVPLSTPNHSAYKKAQNLLIWGSILSSIFCLILAAAYWG